MTLLWCSYDDVTRLCDGGDRLSRNRSAALGNLKVPRTRTNTYGHRSFRLSGPVAWNSLPHSPESQHVVQCFQVSVKDLPLQTESSLMFYLTYICTAPHFDVFVSLVLLNWSMCLVYFDVFCKAQCGGLLRCCVVEELGLLLLFLSEQFSTSILL